ncbi:MAG: ATP-grasp domain-containing protein [Pirellulales bacterium]|nr:ATP-grasp domain-containing protein [Pirellulales bacterium]
MRLFVYEHLMAGGFGPQAPASLLAEGRAMLVAIVEDFAAAGHDVVTVLADRVDSLTAFPARVVRTGDAATRTAVFHKLAHDADWTLAIAPEIGGALTNCHRAVDAAQGRWLGSSLEAIRVASDKHATAEALLAAGVPVPEGVSLGADELPPVGFPFPAVLKPCDGAGSQDVILLHSRSDAITWPRRTTPQRLERYCPGLAASVALLVGANTSSSFKTDDAAALCATASSSSSAVSSPALLGKPAVAPTPGFETAATYALPPCQQHLSSDGRFAYLGGSTPIEPALAARAERLARQAVAVLPGLWGYVGVDLVLGERPDGGDDVVIEINPRLTTSYLGLRKLAHDNLATALLDVAAGRSPRLRFGSRSVCFTAR